MEDFEKNLIKNKRKSVRAANDFRHALKSKLEARIGYSSAQKFPFVSKFRNFFMAKNFAYCFAGMMAVCLIVVGIFVYFKKPGATITSNIIQVQNSGKITLAPTKGDALGTALDTDFKLVSTESLDYSEVKNNLKIDQPIDFEVDKINDKEFLINPSQDLEKNKVYSFSLVASDHTYSWAYETKKDFKVVSTLPRNQATEVPLDSGIEIEFSLEGFTNYQDNFSIEPAVQGSFEVHKRTLVFVPESLQANTLYTVTLKAGMNISGSDEALSEDYSWQFATMGNSEQYTYLYFAENAYTSFINEAPSLSMNGWLNEGTDIQVSVWQYNSVDEYISSQKQIRNIPIWADFLKSSYSFSTDNLNNALNFSSQLQDNQSSYYRYIVFPQSLDRGYYLVELAIGKEKRYTHLQITDLTAYLSTSDEKSIVWVNDASTGLPVSGANVSLVDGNVSATTDSSGLATFTMPETDNDSDIFKIDSGSDILVASLNNYNLCCFVSGLGFSSDQYNVSYSEKNNYWLYFYTDRPIYSPSDQINFWGLAKNRKNPDSPLNLEITLSTNDWNGQELIAEETSISTSDFGTFTGSISFENLTPSSYALTIKNGEDVLMQRSIEVASYTKPAYQIMVTPEKKVLIAGETFKAKVRAQFFDGTPVSNINILYSGAYSGSVKLDENGEADLVIEDISGGDSEYSSYATYNDFYFYPEGEESSDIYYSMQIKIYPADFIATATSQIEEGKMTVKISAEFIDFTKLNNGEADFFSDPTLGPKSNTDFKIKVSKTTYEQIETGTYYDFVNKKTRKTYDVKQNKTDVAEVAVKTDSNGEYIYELSGIDSSATYTGNIIFEYNGKKIKNGFYAASYFDQYINEDRYVLQDKNKDGEKYVAGDSVGLTFKKGQSVDPDLKSYLFMKMQNGIEDYSLQNSPEYGFIFSENDIPDVYVGAVAFDGQRYVIPDNNVVALYDYTEKELEVSISKDKESYEPGAEVKLTISVKDKDGNGKKAEVNVNLVDEAIYEMLQSKDRIKPLETIYSPLDVSSVRQYATTEIDAASLGAEKGGGGSTRSNFKDQAYFSSVTTDDNGQAQISFTLPDNITSWRITAQAITKDLFVGDQITNLDSGLPFFATSNLSAEYLTGDEPKITLHAYGDILNSSDDVSFNVKISDLNFENNSQAKAFAADVVNLPKLSAGNYEVSITAQKGENKDTIIQKIIVLDSRFTISSLEQVDLSDATNLSNQTVRSKLVFTNKVFGPVYSGLQSLSWEGGDRVDQGLPRIIAQKELNDQFDEENIIDEFSGSSFQTEEGGISILPYSDNDLALSAKIAALGTAYFDDVTLANYFYNVLESEESNIEEVSKSLYGLASLGEPVLYEIDLALQNTDLTPGDKIYLALALDELGAKEGARKIYREIVDEYKEDFSNQMRLKIDNDEDEYLTHTALIMVLGASLNESDAPEFFNYLEENYSNDYIFNLERILYLKATLLNNKNVSPVSFVYTLNGSDTPVSLEASQTYKLNLGPDELAQIKFKNIAGAVELNIINEKSVDLSSITKDNNLSIKRSYKILDNGIVEIVLDPDMSADALDGGYRITDYLPSGLKIITQPYTRGLYDNELGYPYLINGNQINFWTYKENTSSIQYYAKIINKGVYKWEAAEISSFNSPASLNVSENQTLILN